MVPSLPIFLSTFEDGGEEFDGVHHRAVKAGMELFGAGCPAGDQGAGPGAALLLDDLVKEVRADGHAEIVVIGFVPEAASHTATFDLGGQNIEADFAEKVRGWRVGTDGLLLAMGME